MRTSQKKFTKLLHILKVSRKRTIPLLRAPSCVSFPSWVEVAARQTNSLDICSSNGLRPATTRSASTHIQSITFQFQVHISHHIGCKVDLCSLTPHSKHLDLSLYSFRLINSAALPLSLAMLQFNFRPNICNQSLFVQPT